MLLFIPKSILGNQWEELWAGNQEGRPVRNTFASSFSKCWAGEKDLLKGASLHKPAGLDSDQWRMRRSVLYLLESICGLCKWGCQQLSRLSGGGERHECRFKALQRVKMFSFTTEICLPPVQDLQLCEPFPVVAIWWRLKDQKRI